jgi:hypothetical protein
MGFVVPFTMFGVAVGVISVWGLRDKRSLRAAKDAIRPRKAA